MVNKLYILCGIPFSGKTTLAKRLVEKLGFVSVDLDEIKFEMYGKSITDGEIDQPGWDRIYQKMYAKIRMLLKSGKTVVHDTGNFTKYERELVRKIADDLKIKSETIWVEIPKEEAYRRLTENRITKTRFDVTDSDFESTVAEMEIPDTSENTLIFKWPDDVDQWIRKISLP